MLLILFFISLAFSQEVCLKVNVYSDDPYLKQRAISRIKQIALESGFKLRCSENSKIVKAYIKISETPLSLSPRQRVSSYNLNLFIKLNGEKISTSVPYSLPYGGIAELPRRKAIEEAFERIRLRILDFFLKFKRRKENESN